MEYKLTFYYELRDEYAYFRFFYKRQAYMITIQKTDKGSYFVSPMSGLKTNKSILTFFKLNGKCYANGNGCIDLRESYKYELSYEVRRRFKDSYKDEDIYKTLITIFERQLKQGLKNTNEHNWSKIGFKLYQLFVRESETLYKKHKLDHLGTKTSRGGLRKCSKK
ncbi:MAG: hypothetical protein ACRCX8_20535 [Sarcina sp.]